jgi:hypothetical protein
MAVAIERVVVDGFPDAVRVEVRDGVAYAICERVVESTASSTSGGMYYPGYWRLEQYEVELLGYRFERELGGVIRFRRCT